jgi:hypothetical protein
MQKQRQLHDAMVRDVSAGKGMRRYRHPYNILELQLS